MTKNWKKNVVHWSVITMLILVMSISCDDDKKEQEEGDGTDSEQDTGDGGEQGTDAVNCDTYPNSVYCIDGELVRPTIGVRSVTVIEVDGEEFKDCNGNEELEPYEDWRLSPTERATDLVGRMSTDQKIGLLWEGGLTVTPFEETGLLAQDQIDMITDTSVRQSLIRWPDDMSPSAVANHINNMQELAESLDLGVPMLITTDPIFSAASDMTSSVLIHQNRSDQITDWPLILGLGAINDADYIKEIGTMQAAQLRAVGVRWMLGPQIDLASEPMWSRVYDTFGSVTNRVKELGTAYIQGLQGRDDTINPFSGIATCLKHYPSSGAQENGMDSHSESGKYAVFPGDNFDEHYDVMKTVIQASNPASLMPCYAIFEDAVWDGKDVEQVGSAFSQVLMMDALRDDIGWDGMVTSDWGAVGFCYGEYCMSMTAWGTEEWTNAERISAYVEAGGHQIGLWSDATYMWTNALDEEAISEAQIDEAAIKVLELSFKVGAFENPYVDADEAESIISSYEADAHDAMMRAFTLLKNSDDILPLDEDSADQNGTDGIQVYFDGLDNGVIDDYTSLVDGFETVTDMADADYAIVRVSARWGNYFGLDGGVPLSYRDPIKVWDVENNVPSDEDSVAESMGGTAAENNEAGNAIADTIEAAIAAKETNPDLKLILVVSTYRPFIIADYLSDIDVLAAEFGATDEALLDMVFQMRNGEVDTGIQPTGTLPMEIPSSQAAVYTAYEDVPHDSADPTFEVGDGITSY